MRIVEARIEIPMGSQNKYEVDAKTGKIKLDRVLFSANFYPMEYGFVENTLSLDGDALDILVMTSAPTFPGCYIDSMIIGGFDMIDCGQEDTKLLAVNIGDPRYSYIRSIDDLPPHTLKELDDFFSTYKTLQEKETRVLGFFDESEACKRLDEAILRHRMKEEKDAWNRRK